MWLIALLVGLVVGAIAYALTGSLVSAGLGALAGAALVIAQRMESRVRAMETRVRALGADVKQPERGSAAQRESLPQQTAPGTGICARLRSVIDAFARMPAAWRRLWVFLTAGNTLVRAGVVVLFFGVALVMHYSGEYTRIPGGARLAGAVAGALVLLAVGWRLRARRPSYAQALLGGGMGVLYLAVFGAAHSFHVLPAGLAFVLLLGIVALAVLLAIMEDAQWIAMLGIAGGFLAPALISNDGGSQLVLFSYYVVLNLGIFAVALYRSWPALNALGLVFTFVVGSVWGARFYLPGRFGGTEPFLILFFLLYVAIAVVHALRQAPRFGDYVDSVIVFGAPLLAFCLQLQLVRNIPHGAAWSALAVATLYLILAAVLHRRSRESLRMLVEAFVALGVIFLTAAIGLALDGRSTAGAWALEGAVLFWIGVRQKKPLVRTFGLLLQLGAGIALLGDVHRGVSELPVLNGFFLGGVLTAFAGLVSSRTAERHADGSGEFAPQLAVGFFLWGLAWWLLAGLHEIAVHASRANVLSASLLFLTVTCAVFSLFWSAGWKMARFPAGSLVFLMAVVLALQIIERTEGHPLAGLGAIAWPLAFLIHFRILRRHEDVDPRMLHWAHTASMWLLAVAGIWEVAWQADHLSGGRYRVVGWALVPIALLALVAAVRDFWPVVRHAAAYLWSGAKPLVAFLALWMLYANFPSDGEPATPRYVPLLNALDIVHVLAFGVAVYWWRAVRASGIDGPREFPSTWPVTAWCVAIFFWANAVLFRTLHHYAGVPYHFRAMFESNLVQMSVSIFWGLLAIATMFVGARHGSRQMWIVGSALMAVVVLKLLLIELPRASAVESVAAIVVVGALLLVVGYMAPAPPREVEAA